MARPLNALMELVEILEVLTDSAAFGELDPAARRAHDLDDPFFDDNIQMRMADVIAGAGHKK